MSINDVTAGKHVPDEFNVIIEIPSNADPIKYEVDKESGAMFVDRFMLTACTTGQLWYVRERSPTTMIRSTCSCIRHFRCSGVWFAAARWVCWRWTMIRRRRQTTGRSGGRNLPPVRALEVDWRRTRDSIAADSAFLRALQDLEKQVVKVLGWAGVDVAHQEILDGIGRYEAEKRVR